MEDYRAQEMGQEGCPPVVSIKSLFTSLSKINSILALDFLLTGTQRKNRERLKTY